MNLQPPATALAATLSGAAAMIAVAPVPDIGFILQAVGVGALVGTAVVLQFEWRQRRRGLAEVEDLVPSMPPAGAKLHGKRGPGGRFLSL